MRVTVQSQWIWFATVELIAFLRCRCDWRPSVRRRLRTAGNGLERAACALCERVLCLCVVYFHPVRARPGLISVSARLNARTRDEGDKWNWKAKSSSRSRAAPSKPPPPPPSSVRWLWDWISTVCLVIIPHNAVSNSETPCSPSVFHIALGLHYYRAASRF